MVVGGTRFRLTEVHRDRSYLTADVRPVEDPEGEAVPPDLRGRVIAQHMKLVEMAGGDVRPEVYQGPMEVSFVVARNAGMELEQKQEFLETESEIARLTFLVDHFEAILSRVQRVKEIRDLSRGDGHANGFPEL